MRIEALSVGPNHASTHCLIHLIVIFYCASKGMLVQGLLRASYRKTKYLEAQPDCSYFIHQIHQFPTNSDCVDLNMFSAPALAIEIAATSLKDDLGLKRLLYEELGIQEYWVVNAETKEIFAFEILVGGGSRRITESIVLPGLALKTIETALTERKTPENRQVMANLMKEFAA